MVDYNMRSLIPEQVLAAYALSVNEACAPVRSGTTSVKVPDVRL